MVCENGAVICCPGLFAGEVIIMCEVSRRSLTIAMNASNPDIEYIVSIFVKLVQKSFTQCIIIKYLHVYIFNITSLNI